MIRVKEKKGERIEEIIMEGLSRIVKSREKREIE